LDAWREGDVKAGDALFVRHFPRVHRFFKNKVHADVLEDLVQQAFTTCVESRSRLRHDDAFETFLLGIAHNLLRMYYRDHRGPDQSLDFEHVSVVDCGAGPSTVAGKRREQRMLLEALRRIPLESQVVLELYYWEELTAPQLAAVLDVPVGTMRGRVRRAKELVRRQLVRLAHSHPSLLESTANNLDGWAASLREMLAPSS
jgi:RNA polymerase sigma-70 factor (ECF subfamily)